VYKIPQSVGDPLSMRVNPSMAAMGSKGDSAPAGAILEALEAIRSLQQCLIKTDARV
jgi:hypothetical protein